MVITGKRRLAAIVFADVVGYSKMMEASEVTTLAGLKAYRRELIDPVVLVFGGRIVKTIGDGLLLEFRSVEGAVLCAVAFQEGVAIRNRDLSEHARMQFRLGVLNRPGFTGDL